MDSSLLPALLARQATSDSVQLLLHLSADLHWFAGHFPGAPLLPGSPSCNWPFTSPAQRTCSPASFRGWTSSSFNARFARMITAG